MKVIIEKINAEADAEKAGFSDEDDVQVVVVEPETMGRYGKKQSPKKKKKTKGGQPMPKGRRRVQPMFFDPNSDIFKTDAVLRQAKDRFEVVCMDMLEWFRSPDTKKKYGHDGGQIAGYLIDTPYGNQRGNHAQDPALSDSVVNDCVRGMYKLGTEDCIACIGCGHIEQVCCHCRCC